MRYASWMIAAMLCWPVHFANAEGMRSAATTVYKLGVSLANGRAAVGSAVLVAPGKLVTSCHTTRDAVEIRVVHREGQMAARAQKSDLRHDVCILEVPELRGPIAPRVASSQLAVGQTVTAVGYGASYRLSVAEGHVTALYRYDAAKVVRTSAYFPRGASGGGLFDEQGRLVGILTFRASVDEQLNYAVPVEWLDRLLDTNAPQQTASAAEPPFWQDEAADSPTFLRAAWLEYAQSWSELEALAVDWALKESDNAEAWVALGRAKLGLRLDGEAVLALRRAAALEPDNARVWYWLASAYRGIGFHEDFVQASTRLGELDTWLSGRLKNSSSASTGSMEN